jgi:formiminoglutamase
VFNAAFAPSVSAPSAIGLQPGVALELIKEFLSSGKLVSADLAEMIPSLDQNRYDSQTCCKIGL